MSADDTSLPDYATRFVNLASARLGAKALEASDEFFAAKDRMLADAPPVFIPGKFDNHGKWMDGWETKRRRHGGHDWCVVRLAHPGVLHGLEIDTANFTGNFPPQISVEAAMTGGGMPAEDGWREIVAKRPIAGDTKIHIPLDVHDVFDTVRLHIYPDGGIARFRVFGQPVADLAALDPEIEYELSAVGHGGRILGYADSHYGSPWPLLYPGRGENMGDGWETRRRRDGGFDWIVIALGIPGSVTRVEVDTAHFKGNYPDRCSIQAVRFETRPEDEVAVSAAGDWPFLMDEQKLEADRRHVFEAEVAGDFGPVSHVRLNSIPDGGISRFRVFGKVAK